MQYLGTWVEQEATNPALRNALGTYVPNPYAGVINTPGCGICGTTIAAGHLMEPFPQFSGFAEPNPPWANSIYNAFQLKVEKHMTKRACVDGVLHQLQVHRRCVRVHQHRMDRRIRPDARPQQPQDSSARSPNGTSPKCSNSAISGKSPTEEASTGAAI